ncbi:MAG: tetratricopeptide repeat protein [Lachnospiraceae bacterium]|nr:tetratricopeptide repeat protein [Lachnospiraceae bacterium]
MDKYELNIKLEQLRKLIKRREYNTAAKIADTIEWNKIKNNQDLLMAADIYEASGKFVNAREVLLYAYERTNLGRQIVYRLCRVAIRLGDIEEAEEFYSEFVKMAAGDNSRYILQYEIARARGNNLDTQIAILSKYLDEEMDDKWAYELAKLYHKADKGQECAKMCDTIILWFSDGKYVEKALELKSLYAPLTKEQQARIFKENIIPVIDRTEEIEDAKMVINEMQGINPEEIKVKDYSNKVSYDTVNIQRELAESMKDIFGEEFDDEPSEAGETVEENNVTETPEDLEKTKEVLLNTKVFVPISKQMLGEEEEVEEDVVSESEEVISDEVGDTVDAEEVAEIEEVTESPVNEEAPAMELEEFIEGQMTIDEVLAMFNLDKDDDIVEPIAEAMGVQAPMEELELEDVTEEVAEDEIVEEAVEELAEESTEEPVEEEPVEEEISEVEEEPEVEEELAVEEEPVVEEEPADEVVEEAEELVLEDLAEIIEMEKAQEVAETEEETESEEIEQPEEILEEDELTEESETVEEIVEAEEIAEPEEAPLEEELEVENEVEEEDGEKVNKEVEDQGFVKRNLSPDAKQELKDFISRFTGVKGIDKQILMAMHSVLKTSANESNFIFIVGDGKTGKTTLAIDMIKVLNKIMENRGRKIAKVPGSSLGGKSMDKFMEKVVDSDIVIEKVTSMGEDSLKQLVDEIRKGDESKIVIFEDEVITSEKFVRNICKDLNIGDNIIILKQSRVKEWAQIALDYIKEEGYEIDEMGTLALHERIDKLHALTIVIQKNHVEQLIDRAIIRHNKKKLGNLFKGSKNNVLTEKDFIEE